MLQQFDRHLDSILEVALLPHRQSKGGMKNFATEDASVIRGNDEQEGHIQMKRQLTESMKASYGAPKSSTESQSTVADASIDSVEDGEEAIKLCPYKLQPNDPAKRLSIL